MAAPIDLSTLGNKPNPGPANQEALDSLSPEQREMLEQMAQEHPEGAAEKVDTAFLVLRKNGQWLVSPDVSAPLAMSREATQDDIYDGCSKTVRNIDISETAQAVVGFQQSLAMHMQQQAQAQRIAQGLKL